MDFIPRFFRKLWIFIRREKFRGELAEEMAFHREQTAKDFQTHDVPSEAAKYAARRQFGNSTQTLEQSHDVVAFGFETALQDFRFAIRQLRNKPGFAATAILVLALGIGASVAIFGFVDAALLKPLPYQDPSRLVGLFESISLGPRFHLSYPDYLDWKRLNTVFSSLDVYENDGFILRTAASAEQVGGARVSDGFFRTLGVSPALGRDFHPGEDLPAAPRTVLLSYAAWQKRFGGREDALGQTVILDGNPNVIIGVLPRDFHFAPAEPAEFWTTLHDANDCRGCHALYGIARLKDGISFSAAVTEITQIAKQLENQYPDSNRGNGATVVLLPSVIIGDVRPILLLLLSGAALLLLIAGVNVTSLLLVRSEGRKREISVRSAVGASRARLFCQFVTEGLVLAVAGGTLGLLFASWATQLCLKLIPADMLAGMPYLNEIGFNFRVLAFACAISLLACALFSLTPILQLSFSDLHTGRTDGGRSVVGTTWRRLGARLVAVELATAVVLLAGAGLLGKSFYHLLHVDAGLIPERLATLRVEGQRESYSKDEQAIALERSVIDRIAGLPGIKSVGLTDKLPLGDGDGTTQFRVVGKPFYGEHNEVSHRRINSGYFATLNARLLCGRYFAESDDASRSRVVIINQALAKQYFPGEDPVGMEIIYNSDSPQPRMRIIGVVDDVKEGPLDVLARAAMYVPLNQQPASHFSIVVRTSQAEQSVLPTVTRVVHQLDPGLAISAEKTMLDRIHDSPAAYIRRSSAWLVGTFAAVALVLAVVGLYGVISYSVSQRTREIGVRMALGAQSRSVHQLILKEAGLLIAIGISVGLICAVISATLMRGLLFGVDSWDLPTLVAVAATLGLCAFCAAYVPARRAASLDPMEVLRAE